MVHAEGLRRRSARAARAGHDRHDWERLRAAGLSVDVGALVRQGPGVLHQHGPSRGHLAESRLSIRRSRRLELGAGPDRCRPDPESCASGAAGGRAAEVRGTATAEGGGAEEGIARSESLGGETVTGLAEAAPGSATPNAAIAATVIPATATDRHRP